MVLLTTDGKDWKYHTAQGLESYVTRHPQRGVGGIYLFHDIHAWTVTAMPRILERLANRGCHFVTVSEYFAARPGIPGRESPQGGAPAPAASQPRHFD